MRNNPLINRSEAPKDDYRLRCRKLGHEVPFSYCRLESGTLPCPRSLDCWYDHFAVEEHLRRELRQEDWDRVFAAPPRPKVITLLDLIEQSKKSA